MTIECSLIVGNTASSAGGGLYDQTSVDISNSTFSGNDGGVSGGAIYTDPARATTTHVLNIDASTIADNTSRFAAWIRVTVDYAATVGGRSLPTRRRRRTATSTPARCTGRRQH